MLIAEATDRFHAGERRLEVQLQHLRSDHEAQLQQLRAKHAVDHLPYQSWCRACVAGRGKADGHLVYGRLQALAATRVVL